MASAHLLILLLFNLFLIFLPTAYAAEWSKLKVCSQLGFCRRQRHFSLPPDLAYTVIQKTVQIATWRGKPALTADVKSASSEHPDLKLAIAHLGHGTFRVVVDEMSRTRDRNIVHDSIAEGIEQLPFDNAILFLEPDHGILTVPDSHTQIRIEYNPFTVQMISTEDQLVLISLFGDRRLRIEAEKKRSTPTPTAQQSTPSGDDGGNDEVLDDDDDDDDGAYDDDDHHDEDYDYDEDYDDDDTSTRRTSEEGENSEDSDCDGCFSETFQTHIDPKLRGPESIGADVSFPFAKHIYGIPERTVRFSLEDTVDADGHALSDPNRLYNLDVFEYELDKTLGLYGAVPLLTARNRNKAVGMLWLNSAETYVDIRGSREELGKKTHWFSESGMMDIFLMNGPTGPDVHRQYMRLTGAPAMPQRFALGYHQCRWNYRDEEDTRMVDAEFDKRDIPYDVLWLDIEHTDGKRYFTWDYSRFPDPTRMQNHLAARGRKMVTIIDPHVKRDNRYAVHKKATEENYYIMRPDGKPFDGWCWPGSSSYFDFTSPRVRQAWASMFNPKDYPHFTEHLYTWNDMNEPSVFSGPETTMPKDMLHEGNVEHRHVHNIYGHYFMQSTFEGLLQGHGGNDRPFVLSRSFFAGSQRYGAIWIGDSTSNWDHLASTVRMLLPLQICGIVFSGGDVGGFFGNPPVDLLIRWYQVGVFQPFFRAHAHLDSQRREPWLFGEPFTSVIAKAIRTRYEYIPFWYTLFAGNVLGSDYGFVESSGGPPMRPLWWHFPDDERADIDEAQWMVGNALLVSPVLKQGVFSHKVYLPSGEVWYDLFDPTGFGKQVSKAGEIEFSSTLDRMFVFQRGGTIVPKQERRRRSTEAMARDPFTLVVALSTDRTAAGELYLDDGKSYDYEKGSFVVRRFTFADNSLMAKTVKDGGKDFVGSEAKIERVVILGYGKKAPKSAVVEEKEFGIVLAEDTGVLTVQNLDVAAAKDDWTLRLLP
eukprot:GFKZ01016066.1.p1 GENE.GFKZ01016066.1~~GFKZ01016066.1.p1  ORF type:complete len:982 (+),score=166.39 GFKZ01016066.1:103-3048(+)